MTIFPMLQFGFHGRAIARYPTTDPDAQTLFDAMSTAGSAPDATRRTYINNRIVSLKIGGVWATRGVIAGLAAHSQAAALINWKDPTKTFIVRGAPTFTTDQGFAAPTSSDWLEYPDDLSVIPGVTLNDFSACIYSRTNSTLNSADLGTLGSALTQIVARNGTTAIFRSNSSTPADSVTLPVSTSAGYTSMTRNNSANFEPGKNGVRIGTVTRASSAVGSGKLTLLRGTATFSTRQLAGAGVGASLTAAQELADYNAEQTYLTALGASV